MTRVLIADNHPIFRQGLRQAIEDLADHCVVAEAADGNAAVAKLELLKPDIATLDLSMPGLDGYEVAQWISQNLPSCRAVIVSMHADKPFVKKAIDSGASAFIAKEDAGFELAEAFAATVDTFFMSSSSGRPEGAFKLGEQENEPAIQLAQLTRSEIRVLQFVARSLTSRDIAVELGVSERTVHSHRNNICAKLGVHGANGLLHYALRHAGAIDAMRE